MSSIRSTSRPQHPSNQYALPPPEGGFGLAVSPNRSCVRYACYFMKRGLPAPPGPQMIHCTWVEYLIFCILVVCLQAFCVRSLGAEA